MLDFIQVGDLGQNRDKFLAKVTRVAGKGNWFWTFTLGKKFYSWELGMQFYEDAFWEYFRGHANLLKNLVTNYNNIYVVNRFDAESGLDYRKQNQNQDHINDIAIRRCLTRFGINFKGKDLLNLHQTDYSDTVVPFHLSHLCDKKISAKTWWAANRFIVVAPEIEDKARFSEFLIK